MINFCSICSLVITVSIGDCYGTHIIHLLRGEIVELILLFIGTYYFNLISLVKLIRISIIWM